MFKTAKTIIYITILINLVACAAKIPIKPTQFTNSQDAYFYITQEFSVNTEKQNALAANYLIHYFAPWNRQDIFDNLTELKHDCAHGINKFYKQHPPIYDANLQPYSQTWFMAIKNNANLARFPNLMIPAIAIHDFNSHLTPTSEPIFTALPSPKKTAPFDNNQQSLVVANTPLFVLHISKDNAWYFVVTPSYTAWAPKQDVAFVGDVFIKQWKAKKFITPSKDNISILDANNNLLIKTRIGEIYPLDKITANYYQVLIALAGVNQHAAIKIGKIAKKDAHIFPEKLTTRNIASLANTMMGNPYGWGGTLGYRDCSSTMMDLFAPFGIWLPRNSAAQVKTSNYINLADLTPSAKIKTIIARSIPFLTLLHMPGHIVLYVGKQNGIIYVFHDTWGEIHSKNILQQTITNIIGDTVITSIYLQRTDDGETILDQADSMRTLVATNDIK